MVIQVSNRAERRRAEKAAKKETVVYHLTQDQIDDMKLKAVQEATDKIFRMFLSIPVMVLHDKFGFGRVRSRRFADYALVWYEAVQSGETSLAEIMAIAEEETGVKFVTEKGV